MYLIKNKILAGKVDFFVRKILTECIYVICISLIIVVTVTTPHEMDEFKQLFTSEVILIWPSLTCPVIIFIKLGQIKKTKVNPTDLLHILAL